jgi:hypothetical protein
MSRFFGPRYIGEDFLLGPMNGLFSAAYAPFTQIFNFVITRLISYFIFFNFKISCICFLSIITRTHVFINLSNKIIPVMSFVIDYTRKYYIQLSKKLNICYMLTDIHVGSPL